MLTITVTVGESYNEQTKELIADQIILEMEHSLSSLSKWESFFEKPFLSSDSKTTEELLWYVRIMTLTPNVPLAVFGKLSDENVEDINKYIKSEQTATWFNDQQNRQHSKETITAEIIYYWMVSLSIPFECQFWHLNRLITLVRVCNEKNNPASKKMSRAERVQQQRSLNEKRKAQMGTSG